MRLFINKSQMTSKCGKNKKVAHEAQPPTILFQTRANQLICSSVFSHLSLFGTKRNSNRTLYGCLLCSTKNRSFAVDGHSQKVEAYLSVREWIPRSELKSSLVAIFYKETKVHQKPLFGVAHRSSSGIALKFWNTPLSFFSIMIGLILHLVVFDWSTIRQSYHFFQPLCMYQQTNVAFSPKIILYKFSESIRCCLFITSLSPCTFSSPTSPSLQIFEFPSPMSPSLTSPSSTSPSSTSPSSTSWVPRLRPTFSQP